MANMTLIGLYNYDNTLFDNLTLPEGINKDIAVNEILMRSGEFEVLYSNLEFNKYQIGKWSEKHYRTFEKWIRALNIEYEPLENYDRMEEWTDTNTGTQTVDNTGTQTIESTGTQTVENTGTETTVNTGTQTSVNSGSESNVKTGSDDNVRSGSDTNVKTGSEEDEADNGNTTEVQVAAYDTATYSNKEKTIFDTDQTGTHTYNDVTDTHTYNDVTDTHTLNDLTNERTDDLTAERTDDLKEERTDDLTNKRTDELTNKRTDDLTGHHIGRTHGNIGVTTSMQLLRDELEVQRFNIYENIADLFIDEFCILIY